MGTRPESLVSFLADDLALLVGVAGEDAMRFDSIAIVGVPGAQLTHLERRAVVGAEARARTESLAVLVRSSAALSFRAARDLGILELPEGTELRASTAGIQEHAATRDALSGMVELVNEVLEIKRNRAERFALRALTEIHRRLDALLRAENERLEGVDLTGPERAFYLPVDLRAMRKVHARNDARDPGEQRPAETRRRLPRLPTIEGKRDIALVASIFFVGFLTLQSLWDLRRASEARGPIPISAAQLDLLIPDARVLGSVEPNAPTGVHVRTGFDFMNLPRAERTRRLVEATSLIAKHLFDHAHFSDPSGDPVADWRDGHLRVLDPPRPTEAS